MASGERLFVAQHKPCGEYTKSNQRASKFTYTSEVSYNLKLWDINYMQKSVIAD
jgi:hypothetical protein